MTGNKYEKYILREPFGKAMRVPGVKAPPGTPIEKPYWIGIGQEEPEAWGFPLSMVLRPLWQPPPQYKDGGPPHSHHVGEVLFFIGGDPMNFKEFGAEVEFTIDGEKYFINSTTFVYIPPEVPHCPLIFKNFVKPIMFGHIMFTPMYESTIK
jgi:mannose-6-phosphate isomerase-like protein (cupin superfamily)